MRVTHPADVIKRPILSEESTIQMETNNKYVFRVDPRATKKQIKAAVEQQWDSVRVESVNTMNYRGKQSGRRGAGRQGYRSKWKKAIVTLRDGDSIDLI